MAIYHMQVRVISRGHRARATASAAYQSARPIRGRRVSVVQSAAYQSGESLHAMEEHRTWKYSRAERVQAEGVVLPDILSPEAHAWYSDRENLWNAVEAAESAENAQLARRLIIALPRELDDAARQDLVETFARDLAAHGMACDWAIHSDHDGPDGIANNPHAHLLVTMRPLTNAWDPSHPEMTFAQDKTSKAYPVKRGNETAEVLAKDWALYKSQGWQKLYNWYDPAKAEINLKTGKVDWRKTKPQRLTMDEGLAAGLTRRSKQPISTRRSVSPWDSIAHGGPKDSLRAWRRQWERRCNEALDAAGRAERVDCRSYRARGVDKIPTVHEGPRVQSIEREARTTGKVQGQYEAATLRHRRNVATKPLMLIARIAATVAIKVSTTAKDVVIALIRGALGRRKPWRRSNHPSRHQGRGPAVAVHAHAGSRHLDQVRTATMIKVSQGTPITRTEGRLLTPDQQQRCIAIARARLDRVRDAGRD